MLKKTLLFSVLLIALTTSRTKAQNPPWHNTRICHRFYELMDTVYNNNGGDNWTVKTVNELLGRSTSPYFEKKYTGPMAAQDGDPAIQGSNKARYEIQTLDLSNNNLTGVLKNNSLWEYTSAAMGGIMYGRFNEFANVRMSYNQLTEVKAIVWGTGLNNYGLDTLYFDHNKISAFLPPRPSRSSWAFGNGAKSVRLNNNNISTIPIEWYSWATNFIYLIRGSVSEFRIENNFLNYTELIKLSQAIQNKRNASSNINPNYEEVLFPQKPLGEEVAEITADAGSTYTLSFSLPHEANTYQWELNGELIPLSNKDYSFTLNEGTAGIYRCKVTNSNFGGTYLESKERAVFMNKPGNQAPNDFSLSNTQVLKYYPKESVVGVLMGSDPDGDEIFYRLKNFNGDNSCFRIMDGNILCSATTLFEYEYKTEYNIIVEAYDIYGGKKEKSFTITMHESNGEPMPTAFNLSSTTINENEIATIGQFELEGVETSEYTFSFEGEGDNTFFEIEGNLLKNMVEFDYETKKLYKVVVKAHKGDIFIIKIFNIIVENANDAPSFLDVTGKRVAINSPIGTMVGYLIAVDHDEEDIKFSFNLHNNEDFEAVDNILYTKRIFSSSDIGNHTITADVTSARAAIQYDSFGNAIGIIYNNPLSATLFTDIEVVDKYENSVILSTNSVIENYTGTVGTLNSTDSGSYTYSLVNGEGDTHNSRFHIEGNQLYLDEAFDAEATSLAEIRVAYGDVETALVLFVQDVNEAPLNIGINNLYIDDQMQVGDTIGTLVMHDPDGDMGAFTTTSDKVSIDSNKLILNAKPASEIYTLTIEASDGEYAINQDFALIIKQENEPPTGIGLTNFLILPEWSIDTEISQVVLGDPDTGEGSFTLESGGDNDYFYIAESVLKLKQELGNHGNKFSITIIASDGDNTYSQDFDLYVPTEVNGIYVIDINDVSYKTYPNPVQDVLTITYKSNYTGPVSYELYTLSGSKVYQLSTIKITEEKTQNINMQDLNCGAYILHIISGSQQKNIQIIKK